MKFHINLFAIIAAMAMTACHANDGEGHEGHDHDHDHNHAATASEHNEDKESGHSDEIVLPPEKAKAAGVVVEEINAGEFAGVIRTGGKILAATGDESTVSATVAGVVTLTRPYTDGMSIGKGAPLFHISSSNLPDGDISTRASIAYQNAKTEYERAEKLVAEKIISDQEFQSLKSAYETARLAYEAVANRSAKGVTVTAPTGGYVKDCMVKDGDFVEVGQPLMTITQNRKLYLRAEVAERDYAELPKVMSANFKPSYSERVYSLADLDGRLVSYGKGASETSAFIPVTFEFNNTGGVLPGAYAEIYLITGMRPNVVSVPVTALTEEQGVYYVYIQVDEEGYRKQEVKLGATDGARVEIVSGINPGDRVVSEGAIHVKLASASNSIPGHTHNH